MSVCLRTKAACKLAETFRSTMYAPEDSEDNIDGFMRGRYDGLSYIIISILDLSLRALGSYLRYLSSEA